MRVVTVGEPAPPVLPGPPPGIVRPPPPFPPPPFPPPPFPPPPGFGVSAFTVVMSASTSLPKSGLLETLANESRCWLRFVKSRRLNMTSLASINEPFSAFLSASSVMSRYQIFPRSPTIGASFPLANRFLFFTRGAIFPTEITREPSGAFISYQGSARTVFGNFALRVAPPSCRTLTSSCCGRP